ncbi:hypothetical protein [Prevotella jejuni]
MRRTAYDTTAYSTVSNEQQADRGISVITPLPTGEGTGEGPVVAVGWFSCCSGLVQLLQWVGSVVVGFGSLYCRVSCCVGCPS